MSARRALIRNGRASLGLPINPDSHGAESAIERHFKVRDGMTTLSMERLSFTANIDSDRLRAVGRRDNGDDIPGSFGSRLRTSLAPYSPGVTSGTDGSGPVPGNDTVFVVQRHVGVAGLVGLDEVRQDRPEAAVVVALDVLVCALDDVGWVRVADVVRLSVVVPGDDLDEVGHDFQDLLPSVVPEGLAGRVPVLVPLGEI